MAHVCFMANKNTSKVTSESWWMWTFSGWSWWSFWRLV